MPWALLTRLSISPLGAETANSELDLALKEPVRSSGVCFKTLSPRTSLRGGMVPPDLPRTSARDPTATGRQPAATPLPGSGSGRKQQLSDHQAGDHRRGQDRRTQEVRDGRRLLLPTSGEQSGE